MIRGSGFRRVASSICASIGLGVPGTPSAAASRLLILPLYEANSSAQERWNWCPLIRSGSSAENSRKRDPLISTISPIERFQVSMQISGTTFKRPLSPSKHTSRPSAKLAAKTPTRAPGTCQAKDLTSSALVRVLPNPRPAKSSQTRHTPSRVRGLSRGVSWFGRAVSSHPAIDSNICLSSGDQLWKSASIDWSNIVNPPRLLDICPVKHYIKRAEILKNNQFISVYYLKYQPAIPIYTV